MKKAYVMAVANKGNLTLYDSAGIPVTVSAKTHDIHSLLALVTPFLLLGQSVELDLEDHLAADLCILDKVDLGDLTVIKTPDREEGSYQVIDSKGGSIDNIEKLVSYFNDAHKNKVNKKSLIALLKRLLAVDPERKHCVQDVLDFLSENNFPLTSSGGIIALKVLVEKDGNYVDWASRKVAQNTGSVVCVPDDYVDLNRLQACAQGLHIASLAYAKNFCGDAVFLVHVKPEDILAVPISERTKVRVQSYFVLDKLPSSIPQSELEDIFNNKAAKALVKKAINEDWPEVLETVTITKPRGEGIERVVVTPVKKAKVKKAEAIEAEPIEPVALDNSTEANVKERVKEAKAMTNKARAQQLYQKYVETGKEHYMVSLKMLKAKAKASFTRLGLPQLEK